MLEKISPSPLALLLEFKTVDNYLLVERKEGGQKNDQRRKKLPSTASGVL